MMGFGVSNESWDTEVHFPSVKRVLNPNQISTLSKLEVAEIKLSIILSDLFSYRYIFYDGMLVDR